MTLIERDGDVRSVHVPNVKKGTLHALAKQSWIGRPTS